MICGPNSDKIIKYQK